MLRQISTAIFLFGFVVCPVAGQGIKFGTDYDGSIEKAKKENKLIIVHFTQKNSPGCASLIKTVFNNMDGTVIAKKYLALKISAEDEKGSDLFQKYAVNTTPTVMILSPQGEALLQQTIPNLAEFNRLLETSAELQSGLEALGKVKKDNAAGLAAALKKIAAVEGTRPRTVLREHAENEAIPEAARRVALEGLGKQKETAGDLVPFLGNKNPALRTIAFSALKMQGAQAMPALIDGLDAFSVDQRANCFLLAYPHTKNPKIARDAAFWKTAKPEMREPAQKAWKEWWDKNKSE